MNDDPSILHALQELAQIEPDAESTRRAIQRARLTLTAQTVSRTSLDWRRVMSLRNVAAAVVALAVICSLTLWLAPSKSNGGLAFGQVQAQVERTKSVQYVETRQDRVSTPKGDRAGPKTENRVMILGRYLERRETRVVQAGDKLENGAMWAAGPDHHISICDAEKGRLVGLDPEKKLFFVTEGTASISPDDGGIETRKIKPQPEVDFYDRIRRVPAEKAEKLPERSLDGKKVIGFRVEEKTERKRGVDTFTRTFWVDPQTKLPVRIEISFRSTDPFMGRSDWVQSDFVFDAPLDRALFSTDPPAGYASVKAGAAKSEESPR
jgi:hypothetical protein